MSLDAKTLLRLLPAIHALRDAEGALPSPGWLTPEERGRRDALQALVDQGMALAPAEAAELGRLGTAQLAGPLASLLAVVAEQLGVLEEDLAQLYDDQFVDTCAEWVLPYLGGVVGYRPLQQAGETVGRPRAEVAHTIALRRRKGTLPVLEQIAYDVSGWPAVAVEFFRRVVTTQSMLEPRPGLHAAPDLRRWEPLLRIGGAFDTTPRTLDVRRIASARGRHGLRHIGIFVWRLGAYRRSLSPAVAQDLRRLRIHPLGIDAPLVTQPATETAITSLATPLDVPAPILRRVLAASPAAFLSDASTERSLRLYWDRADGLGRQPVPAVAVRVCHLGDAGAGWAHLPPAGQIAVDPELGRLALPPEATAAWRVWTDAHHARPADLGGGEYPRADSLAGPAPAQVVRVPQDAATIAAALALVAGDGVVEITDSGRYAENLAIAVAAAGTIELRARDGAAPVLELAAPLAITGGVAGRVRLNGLLVSGAGLRVGAGGGNALGRLEIVHCTLVPGGRLAPDKTPLAPAQASLRVDISGLEVQLQRSIVGALVLQPDTALQASDSIVDATGVDRAACTGPANGPGGELALDGCTVIGRIHARKLLRVSNCILLARAAAPGGAPVRAALRQQGCVRFSWLPPDSRTPRRHRCLPESADDPLDALLRFTAMRYGEAAYLQLARGCGELLLAGGDDDAQPGAYHHLHDSWREGNLRRRLDEYLRVGLEAGVLHDS